MSSANRARAAGRRFGSAAVQTGMAMGGGAVYYGLHALLSPSIYGTNAMNIPKRSWILPVAGVIGGNLLTMAPKVGAIGLGLAGGATAIGVEQIQMGVSIKKNAAASGQTSGVGALLEPRDVTRAALNEPVQTGYMEEEDAGALWQPASYSHEAAGLSL